MERPEAVRRIELQSGEAPSAAELFDQWEAQMSELYVPLAVSPVAVEDFRGWINRGCYSDVELSTIGSTPQHVRRTERLIARTDDEFLTATIQTRGRGRLHQDGRVAAVAPGTMVFYDSTRPYRFELDDEWAMAVVQVPLRRLREQIGATDHRLATAVALPRHGPAGLVSRYFRELATVQDQRPEQTALLVAPALNLLAAAVNLAAGSPPPEHSSDALARQRVLAFIRTRCTDPELTVDRIAEGCMMSRRTLYRVFDDTEEGPAAFLRSMRVERACELLTLDPRVPIAVVAHASGFLTERHFYRAFRHEKATTPAAFRALDSRVLRD